MKMAFEWFKLFLMDEWPGGPILSFFPSALATIFIWAIIIA
jgi:hypothetical protein